VRRVLATSREPGVPFEIVAAHLRTHHWVEDARPPGQAAGAILLVPSAAGIGVLRSRGKVHMVAEWERYLRCHGVECTPQIDIRLIEALPAEGHEPAPAELRPTWMPVISALQLDISARSLTCRLLVSYDMPIFRGHFRNVPIVPGVMQVGWAVELARTHGVTQGRLAGVSTAKFRRLVQPGMCLAACVEQGGRKGQLCFTYALRDTVISTGRLHFEDGDD
jgi:hypothetical protein